MLANPKRRMSLIDHLPHFQSFNDRRVKVGTTQAGKSPTVCLCPGLHRALKERGLGEPFGKASLADTDYRLGKFISMTNRSS